MNQDYLKGYLVKAAKVLSTEAREHIKPKNFAIPSKAKTPTAKAESGNYPIPNASHARNALSRVSQFGSSAEKAKVRAAVTKKFPGIGDKTAEAFVEGFFGKIAVDDPRGGLLAPTAASFVPGVGPAIYGAAKSKGDRLGGAMRGVGGTLVGSGLGAGAGAAAGGGSAMLGAIAALLAKKPQLAEHLMFAGAPALGAIGSGVGTVAGAGMGTRRAVMGKKPE